VYGSTTLFNLVFLTGLGTVFCYASFRLVKGQADMHTWVLVSLFLSAMMTYACAILARVHVSRPAMSQLLGLLGRPRNLALPRTT
jgi:hypothetical protein